ncbi:GNAT family N-acetyltransferase [Humibacter ginsenosidimutans]|uniref:GNAT family N-acetyltransferase n=1 Tax=Humibacter ginsenosidimutans TaxID=2599293 RepID=A0A5B8M5W0_9MICO|nr:GNAT family protein [Humibacter ginsenosidimutans]QDZ15601.1 GNAT family N-acetyltransferase [Humibacter ginsenosidimutans]
MTSETTVQSGLLALPFETREITTERLHLRPLTKADLEHRSQNYQKRSDVVRYLRWEAHDHDEPAKNLEHRIALERLSRDGDGLIFAVELCATDGSSEHRVIGDISLSVKSAKDAQAEIGWVFHPAVHGRGYATEAAKALLNVAFGELGAHRVYAELDAANEASARLCEILGMTREALLRDRDHVDGEWHDVAIFGLLADEFAAQPAG